MSLPAQILAALLLALFGVGAGWRLGIDHAKAKQADIDAATQQTRATAAESAASAIAAIEVKHVTIRQAVQREILEKPVFRDCHSGPDAVRLLNAAAGYSDSEPAGDGQLPAASAPGK